MESKAIYSFNEKEQPASIVLLKNKLSIRLNNQRELFWYYEQISRKNVYEFNYGNYPPQIIRLSSSTVADELENRISRSAKKIPVGKMAPLLKVILFFLLFLVLAYFLLVPWIASALANRFPISYERSIGEQTFNAMKADFIIDEKRTAYINHFFDEMKLSSAYDIQIVVVKGEIVNAFALPGGRIVVYDALIEKLGSYPELAAMLAHEFIHGRRGIPSKYFYGSWVQKFFFP